MEKIQATKVWKELVTLPQLGCCWIVTVYKTWSETCYRVIRQHSIHTNI